MAELHFRDPHLRSAFQLLFGELVAFLVAGYFAQRLGYAFELLLVPLLVFNLAIVPKVYAAAKANGYWPWLYCAATALGPPGAIFAIVSMRLRQDLASLQAGPRQ